MSNSSCFLAEDIPYHCKYKTLLRYNSGLGFAIEVSSGDSSVESIISQEQHICNNGKKTIKSEEVYLDAQKRERDLQHEIYGKFESTSEFNKPITKTGRPTKEK